MIIKNPNNLPEAIVNAVYGDYKRSFDPDRFSVTSLVAPPLIRFLESKYSDEIETDVEDMTWLLFGRAFHLLMEKYATEGSVAEKKTEIQYKDITLVGIPDVVDGSILYDYKTTSVWSFILGDKKEWEQQLNIYRYMLNSTGVEIKEINIIAILRDWVVRKAQIDGDYPQKPLIKVPVPMWSLDKVTQFIDERIEAHRNLTPCTPEERWRKETTYAVKANGVKTAKRVLSSEQEAEEWIKNSGLKGLYIEERTGEDSRCLNYCSVAKWCTENRYKLWNGMDEQKRYTHVKVRRW